MFNDIKEWFTNLVKEFFEAIWSFFKDILIAILELFLDAIVAVIGLIPLPDFLTTGLSNVVLSFPPLLLFMMAQTGIPEMLALFASAVLFRLTRKAITLGQW